MIRVAFLTPSLHVGGAERWLLSLTRHFQQARTVGIAVRSEHVHPMNIRSATCPIHIAESGRGGTVEGGHIHRHHYATDAIRAACEHADVLISWGCGDLKALTENPGIPIVDVSHSDGAWADQTRLLADSHWGADHLVAVSRAAATAFPEHLRRSVTVIPNGAELDRVVQRIGRDMQRQMWGIRPDQKVALFLGRIELHKGADTLVSALDYLPAEWIVLFVGHGSATEEIKRMAADRHPRRVGFVDPVETPGDAFAASEVFVLPSFCEGHPLTINEAWLAKLPVVTCDYNFAREMDDRHGKGVMFKTVPVKPTAEELATGILEALAEQRPQNQALAAFQIAWNLYTAPAMAFRWERWLAAILTDRMKAVCPTANVPVGVNATLDVVEVLQNEWTNPAVETTDQQPEPAVQDGGSNNNRTE